MHWFYRPKNKLSEETISVAVRSEMYVWSRLIAGIAGSNPAEGMGVMFVVCRIGSDFCNELITRSEIYRVCVAKHV
jgi:hypothetical protein